MSQLIVIVVCMLFLKMSYTLDFEESLAKLDDFFNSLKQKYESKLLTDEVKTIIDEEINEYMQNSLKELSISRTKKELNNQKIQIPDSAVFNNLEAILNIKTIDTKDFDFFKKYNGYEQWFVVALTSRNVTVYRIHENSLLEAAAYYFAQEALKVHVVKLHGDVLLIIETSEQVKVLHFFPQDGKFLMRKVQDVPVNSRVKHLRTWSEKEQLFLALSTSDSIDTYFWKESSFRPLRALPLEVEFTSPILLFSADEKPTILEFAPQRRRFVVAQIIRKAFRDAKIIQLNGADSSVREYFLAACNGERTILYKRSNEGPFRPFQEIGPADSLVFATRRNAAVLLLLKDNVIDAYQYDGWRFVQLNYQLVGAQAMKSVGETGEELMILVRSTDGSWSLNKINWMKIEEPIDPMGEILSWCSAAKETAKRVPKLIPKTAKPIRISNGRIRKIRVKNVNGIGIKKLQNLTERYNQLIIRTQAVSESLNKTTSADSPTFGTLQSRTVRVKCAKNCRVENLIAKMDCDVLSNLRRIDDERQSLEFEHVKVEKLNGHPCPVAAVDIKQVQVKGWINGISLDDLQNNALRTHGNQLITGNHIFSELHVDSVIAPNIDVASSKSRQKIWADAIHAKELSYPDGGLLPLDGEPVTMTGTLDASRVKLDGLVELHCHLDREAFDRYEPMVYLLEHRRLVGNYTLDNVEVRKLLRAEDLARDRGRSFGEIAEKAVRLGEVRVPVRLNFFKDSTIWTNVTAKNLPNFLGRRNSQRVKVTGKKLALKTVSLPESVHSRLPMPRLQAYTCLASAKASNVKTSTLRVGRATAKHVFSENVYGAKELDDIVRDAVTSMDEVDLSHKTFTGSVYVENLNVSTLRNSPFFNFENTKFRWYDPYFIEESVKGKDLKVNYLHASKGIKIPSPTKIRNMIVEGNLEVERLNGIDWNHFIYNMARTNDSMFVNEITFGGSVEVEEIEVTNTTNIDLRSFGNNRYLGNKIITGKLNIENDLSIPNVLFTYPPANEVSAYIIEGSVSFSKEPHVESLNGQKLHELISKVWMLNRPSNLKGKFTMKNVTFSQPFESYNLLNTPDYGSWKSLEKNLLSKTKLQEIEVPAHFAMATIPNIITRGNSTLHSADAYLNDFLNWTLKKNRSQVITDSWRLQELTINGNITLLGKINNLNLSSDVARFDVERNEVTGEKIINDLATQNLNGLNFGQWAKDVFMQTDNIENPIIITGRKKFDSLNARILKVNGMVTGKKLENCLLKTGDQNITEPKLLRGSLYTQSLTVGGLINEVNVTDFVNNRLHKQKPLQKIKSNVVFKGNLQILGNFTIGKSFEEITLSKLNKTNESFTPLLNAIEYLKPLAVKIQNAFNHRAKYWTKFEEIEENTALSADCETSSTTNFLNFPALGNCSLTSFTQVVCNNTSDYPLKSLANSSEIIVNKMMSIQNVPLVIQIDRGQRSRITIHKYNDRTNSFDVSANLRLPGTKEASVIRVDDVAWIAAQLASHMLIVRYQPRYGLHKYHLPESQAFALDRLPATNENLLVRDDGMWKLEGLAGPRLVSPVDLRGAKSFESFSFGGQFFVRFVGENNVTRLFRTICVGV